VRNLCFFNCGLTDQAAFSIAKIKNLEVLDLSNNQFGELGAKHLAAKLLKLREMVMNFNRVGDEGIAAISNNLRNLVKL